MASKNSKLLPITQQAVSSISEWLRSEHEYQFAENGSTPADDPTNSRARILMFEVPDRWEQFQDFRNQALLNKNAFPEAPIADQILLRIGQNLLKCAAAAQTAYVCSGVVQELSIPEALENSFKGLEAYTTGISDGRLRIPPSYLLGATAEEAIKTYNSDTLAYANPGKTFIALTGLAIAGIVEFQERSGKTGIILPEPGLPSGELITWQPPAPTTAA